MEAIARNTDPRTSLYGEVAANQRRKDDKQTMLDFIARHPWRTGNELRQLLVDGGMSVYRAETLRKRISDLKAANRVCVHGRRECRETGKVAQTYVAI